MSRRRRRSGWPRRRAPAAGRRRLSDRAEPSWASARAFRRGGPISGRQRNGGALRRCLYIFSPVIDEPLICRRRLAFRPELQFRARIEPRSKSTHTPPVTTTPPPTSRRTGARRHTGRQPAAFFIKNPLISVRLSVHFSPAPCCIDFHCRIKCRQARVSPIIVRARSATNGAAAADRAALRLTKLMITHTQAHKLDLMSGRPANNAPIRGAADRRAAAIWPASRGAR